MCECVCVSVREREREIERGICVVCEEERFEVKVLKGDAQSPHFFSFVVLLCGDTVENREKYW